MSRLRIVLLIVAMALASCARNGDSPPPNQAQKTALVAELTSVTARPARAPNFAWKDQAGTTVDFDSYRGKVTLVNFWATWCVPCKRELPDLVALSKELSDKNVKILGVSTDRGSSVVDEVSTFVREHGIPYQNIISNDEIEEAFGNVRMIPTSFLVNGEGKIVQTFVGARSKELFTQAIIAALK